MPRTTIDPTISPDTEAHVAHVASGRGVSHLAMVALAILTMLMPRAEGLAQSATQAGRPSVAPPALRRGINLGDYLAYPSSPTWPIFGGLRASTTDEELRRLRAVGFDFVRLSVEPSPFLDRSADQVRQLEQRLVSFVKRINAAGLRVMVTGWPRHETTPGWRANDVVASVDSEAYRRYLGFLKRMIVVLQDIPLDQWVLEPINEPQSICQRTDGPDWTVVQRHLYAQLRNVAPRLTLVLTPSCWSSIRGLEHFDMAGYDARTLVDWHYYDPFTFTHQSATWTSDEWRKYIAGLSFPPSRTNKAAATDASARLFMQRQPNGGPAGFQETLRQIDVYVAENFGPERIAQDFAKVRAWADKQGLAPERVILGEFGAYRQPGSAKAPDDGSRARWHETIRSNAERLGFGWAYHAYHSDFGLVADDATGAWDNTIPPALGLKPRP
jgi:endoglucanase